MDKKRKKELRQAWRADERAKARSAFPVPVEALRALFDMLDRDLPSHGCDHSRRLTRAWLESRGHDVTVVFEWLDEQGGYCDCEVLANVEQHVDDALADWTN